MEDNEETQTTTITVPVTGTTTSSSSPSRATVIRGETGGMMTGGGGGSALGEEGIHGENVTPTSSLMSEEDDEEVVVFDVFMSDPLRVDLKLFSLWTHGNTESESVAQILADNQQPQPPQQQQQQQQASQQRVREQKSFERQITTKARHEYHLFRLLGEKLERPTSLLGTRLEIRLPEEIQTQLIEVYYSFDDVFARELIGKKLTYHNRREVDDISEKTGIPLASCLRQFDNFRRVYKVVQNSNEEQRLHQQMISQASASSDPGASTSARGAGAGAGAGAGRGRGRGEIPQILSACEIIKTHFRLSPEVTQRYIKLSFLIEYRPEVTHRRLQHLAYAHLERLAERLIQVWHGPECSGLSLRVDFKEVRDAKARIKRDTELLYRNAVLTMMTSSMPELDGSSQISFVEARFRQLVKSLASIGAELADQKEFADMLEKLLEEVVDVLFDMGLRTSHVAGFFDAMVNAAKPQLIAPKHRPSVATNWQQFLVGMKECCLWLADHVGPA